MKFKARKGDLDTTVQIAGVAVGNNDDDYSGHFLIRFREGGVELLGANGLRLVAGGPIVGAEILEGDDGAAFTLVAWRLRALLATVKSADDYLEFHHENGVTKVKTPGRGSGKFGSLDPKTFPVIDKTMQSATVLGEMEASRLNHILSYARQFVSDQETRSPHLVAMASRDGVLHATDSVGIVQVISPLLSNSKMRVHGKDASPVLSFLALKGSEKVSLLEHDQCIIVKRSDNHFLAIGQWLHDFPNLNIDRTAPAKCSFSISTEDLIGAIKYLEALARKDDQRLHFRFSDGKMVLSMESASGDGELAEQYIDCVASENMEKLEEAGYKDFILQKRFVGHVAAAQGDVPLKFNVSWLKNNGFVFTTREESGDEYFTLIVWIRKK